MAFIPQEQPAGAINGINKVYTLTNAINTIDFIIVDGLTYLGSVTPAGNTITLGDAPVVSIYVWYYSSPPPIPPPTPVPGKISLQDAYTALKNRLKDISDVPQSTFIQWCSFVNQFAYRFLLGVDPDRFIKTVSFTLLAGQDTYPLDTDFRDMATWNTGFFITSPTPPAFLGYTTQSNRLPLSGPGNQYLGYYIDRGNFIFTPMPTVNQIFTKKYTVNITTLSDFNQWFTLDGSSTGIAIIPEEYLLYIVNALADQYAIWDEEVGAESYADARFVRSLNELCDCIRRQPATIGMLDFSQIY